MLVLAEIDLGALISEQVDVVVQAIAELETLSAENQMQAQCIHRREFLKLELIC